MSYKHLTALLTGSIARAIAKLHRTLQTMSGQIWLLEELSLMMLAGASTRRMSTWVVVIGITCTRHVAWKSLL